MTTTDNPFMAKVARTLGERRDLYTAALALSERLREAMGISTDDLKDVPHCFAWRLPHFTVTKNFMIWTVMPGVKAPCALWLRPSPAMLTRVIDWRCVVTDDLTGNTCWLPDERATVEVLDALREVVTTGVLHESVRL